MSSLRSRYNKKKLEEQGLMDASKTFDDQFCDLGGLSSFDTSLNSLSSNSMNFTTNDEKKVYEDHLDQLQEQLVAAMIKNQTLEAELVQYKDNETNERLREELMRERSKNMELEVQLRHNRGRKRGNSEENTVLQDLGVVAHAELEPEVAEEAVEGPMRSKLDRLWEDAVDKLYDLVEDFSEMTKPEDPKEVTPEPLSVKKLKENLKRFKLASTPYVDTVRGFYNLISWKSPSYTLIFLLLYMYCVWRGWVVPMVFFLAGLRVTVNFLHSKNIQFRFAYFDPGDPEQETEDALGISDKFNLVLQVATKVQNGLGSAADGLEKMKNLFTWRHPEGTRRVLTMLCVGFIFSAVLPTSIFWKFIGFSLGVKIFFINYVYNRFPRVKQHYDGNSRLWKELPTDAEYDRQYVQAEMDKYIVIPRDETEQEQIINSQSSDSDSEDDESQDFRQLFSLPPSEHPQEGWSKGKRTVLIGRDRSLMTLLTKKRGKLYLTKSFLCFEREKAPTPRNIVIPLQEIVSIDKVKINQRLPGRGMSIQITLSSNGKDNILMFGGLIGREDVVRSIKQAVEASRRQGMYLNSRPSTMSFSSSSNSSINPNFTFAASYVDSE